MRKLFGEFCFPIQWGEDKKLEEFFILPPYTNESLAIRYPPMLLQSRNIGNM